MKKDRRFVTESFPDSRLATIDIGQVGLQKHHIKALVELDVTEARRMLREKKKISRGISFTSWLIKCISAAAEEYPQVHGMRKGKNKAVLFRDVDISIMIEREVQGKKVPLPYVIRKTNEKSIEEICKEIKSGQNQPVENESDYVLGEKKKAFLMKLYYLLPGFVRKMIWKIIISNPHTAKSSMGTVAVTAVGMMGKMNGWVIPVSIHPLCFAVGSIIKKPGVAGNKIVIREYLYLTALVDHDVIDGAPAVRFLSRFTEMVEKGEGLS